MSPEQRFEELKGTFDFRGITIVSRVVGGFLALIGVVCVLTSIILILNADRLVYSSTSMTSSNILFLIVPVIFVGIFIIWLGYHIMVTETNAYYHPHHFGSGILTKIVKTKDYDYTSDSPQNRYDPVYYYDVQLDDGSTFRTKLMFNLNNPNVGDRVFIAYYKKGDDFTEYLYY